MKIGNITTTNAKGQVVIPKKIRDKLGIGAKMPLNITMQGNGVYLQPINGVSAMGEKEQSYLKVLEKTKGAWSDDDWDAYQEQRKSEQAKTKQAKHAW